VIIKAKIANSTESEWLWLNPAADRGPANVPEKQIKQFDAATFLANAGFGRRILHFQANEILFSQGMAASSIFYMQKGRAKLTVVSRHGKEATITLLCAGDFIGEESVFAVGGVRLATCKTMSACAVLMIERTEFMRMTSKEPTFSDIFLSYVLTRSMRTQADLVDHLFNNCEKRLARILLLMADFGEPGKPELVIPPITQTALAEMIGTTRSRVSFLMNRFRQLGFIEYKGRIKVNKSLLNILQHDGPQEAGQSEKTTLTAHRGGGPDSVSEQGTAPSAGSSSLTC
jgi:CRP/FNR family cyclic AMP-dependent transcriptional regulator